MRFLSFRNNETGCRHRFVKPMFGRVYHIALKVIADDCYIGLILRNCINVLVNKSSRSFERLVVNLPMKKMDL